MIDEKDDLPLTELSEPAQVGDARATPEAPAVTRGTLVTRGGAAEMLDTSKTSIRRLEKKGELKAAEIASNGAHLFELEQVRQVERRVFRARSAPASTDAYDGAMAREVFGLFDEQVHPVDVVKQTGIDPRSVKAMYEQWLSLRGGFLVPAEAAAEICSLPWFLGPSLSYRGSAEKLLKVFKAMRPRASCSVCESRLPEVCTECAKDVSVKDASRRASEASARREAKEQDRDQARFMKALENNVRDRTR